MAQYIDKSDIKAEIDRQKIGYNVDGKHSVEYDTTRKILNIIDGLEAKEVDLEKEIDNVWNPHFNLGWDDNSLLSINHKSFEFIAKHFFELGIQAREKE